MKTAMITWNGGHLENIFHSGQPSHGGDRKTST
jgi:hypothetical protein